MNRRAFLRLGTLGPAMLALGSLPLAALPLRAEGAEGGEVLDADEAELWLAIAERMVDTGEPEAPSPRDVGALAAIQGVLEFLDGQVVDQLKLALWLVDWWPALLEGRFHRFGSLSAEERDQSLEGWRTSRFQLRRRVFYALRNLALLGYWSRDETWGLIGYGGPWVTGRP